MSIKLTKEIQQKELAVQEKMRLFTERAIMVKNVVKEFMKSENPTEWFVLLSDKLNKNYPLAPWRKEELLLYFWDKVQFSNKEECITAIDSF